MKKMLSIGLIAAFAATSAPTYADDEATLAKGKRAYNKCKACHTLTDTGKKRAGPHLENIFGREAAALEGFKFSKALTDSGITWDEETLDKWIASPRKYLPGNRMTFVGIRKPEERAALIAYLKKSTKAE